MVDAKADADGARDGASLRPAATTGLWSVMSLVGDRVPDGVKCFIANSSNAASRASAGCGQAEVTTPAEKAIARPPVTEP
jgi:hypothetical protein